MSYVLSWLTALMAPQVLAWLQDQSDTSLFADEIVVRIINQYAVLLQQDLVGLRFEWSPLHKLMSMVVEAGGYIEDNPSKTKKEHLGVAERLVHDIISSVEVATLYRKHLKAKRNADDDAAWYEDMSIEARSGW